MIPALILISLFFYFIWPKKLSEQLKINKLNSKTDYIAFFHPTCDMGGGGERVLWTCIKAILSKTDRSCIIYTRSIAKTDTLLSNVKMQFGFDLDPKRIVFLKLHSWKFLEANRYPRFTLILSSLGSMITGWEAFTIYRPKVFVESVGYAFIYPIAKLFGANVVAYVHYPTISSDMLKLVQDRTVNFNNTSFVAKSSILSLFKVYYYRLFSIIYRFVGSFSDYTMTNSKWTNNHLVWKSKTSIVYPPSDTTQLIGFPLENRSKVILSVAQFRYV